MQNIAVVFDECNTILLAFFFYEGGKVILRWKGGKVILRWKGGKVFLRWKGGKVKW